MESHFSVTGAQLHTFALWRSLIEPQKSNVGLRVPRSVAFFVWLLKDSDTDFLHPDAYKYLTHENCLLHHFHFVS